MLPPLKATGRTLIEIYGPAPASATWDGSAWGQATWALLGWHDVTPLSMVCKVSWGADDPAGVLTVPAAGAWDIDTYDPDRKLDPSNGSSPFAVSLHPGKPMRVSWIDDTGTRQIVRQGLIDEVEYDLRERTGSIRGTDTVPLIVNAKLDAGQNDDPDLPDTLRARASYLLAKVGLDKIVPLEKAPNVQPNPSFEVLESGSDDDPEGWNASNSSFDIRRTALNEQQEEDFGTPDGKYILRVECLVAGTGGAVAGFVPGVPGARYRASAYAMLGSGAAGRMIRLRVQSYDASNAQIGTIEQDDFVVVNTGFQHFEGTEFTFPDDGVAVSMRYAVMIVAGLPGEFVRFDLAELRGPIPNDPRVGPLPNDQEASVWSLISTSAYDALYAMWLNRFGELCFRSFGAPVDNGFTVGGDEGIPISTIRPNTSIENVYTAVHGHDMDLIPPNDEVHALSQEAVDIYGLITLTRNKPVPNAQVWVDSVLADRAGASLQYETGTLYPRDVSDLLAILDLGMVEIMTLVADDVSPDVRVATRVLGGKLTLDTGTGVTAEVTGYIPGHEWEEQEEAPPVEPPTEPPPDVETQPVTRTYDATKDTRAARTSGGANYGSGTEGEIPVGAWQGWRNRAFIDFADIPFAGVVSVDKATLELDTTTQVNVGFGSSPKITVKRVTAAWNEGTLSSPGSANSTVYPGPAVTGTDAKTVTVTRSENAAVAIDITGIARAWFNGSAQHGVGLFSAGEDSTAYTTEFWTRENSTTGKRPRLVLNLTVEV